MSYSYERGGAARFGDLCLALIGPDYEEIQLLELGRPDSGRYGFDRFPDVAGKVVLQVAYELMGGLDATDQALAVLEAELPKILELGRRGATRYIFATNLPRPDADPETGTESLQSWLAANCPIPATGLWREDVDRRLDWAPPATGLGFPEVLDRRNAVAGVLESMFGGTGDQTLEALVEVVTATYRHDLALTRDVFVDVPFRDDPDTGSAALLLAEGASPEPTWRLLEGESGSGKSTVARYVRSIHAARLLDDRAYLESVQADHVKTAFRLPLAIDARDYAVHLDSRFAGDPRRGPDRTFEAFVAAMLDAALPHSPTLSAVRAMFRIAPWLVLVDGLDELGDDRLGERVSTSILGALSSLRKLGADIQLVLVSRPAVPGSLPSQERALLSPLQLGPLAATAVTELTTRWLSARGIAGARAAGVNETLATLLGSPSFRDLASNPMRFRMLLDLVLVDGISVPDRRTDLFDAHERITIDGDEGALAELREHRHLVGEFTSYLAWTLHRDAEAATPAFGLSADGLASLAAAFLDEHDHPAHVVGPLVAAVQRLPYLEQPSGRLTRFRDQSVREFLCARHLFASTPAVDARSACLAVLASQPHWANVARFFAGLYDGADLARLVQDITALIAHENPAVSLHARELGHAILGDRVLRSRPRMQESLVHAVFDGAGVELTLRRPYGRVAAELAADCGRQALRDLLMRGYLLDPSGQMRDPVARLLELNGGRNLLAEFSAHAAAATAAVRTERLSAMFRAGAHRDATADQLESLVYDDEPAPKQLYLRLTTLLDAGTTAFSDSPRMTADLISQLLKWGAAKSVDASSRIATFATVVADGKNTVAVIEGLAVARDYDSAAIAIEAIRTEFGDSWATFALASAACGIPRHSGVSSAQRSLMDAALPLCDRALAARLWRGRSAWWAEELARATSRQERMFWAVVLVAWGSSNYVTDHLDLLDSTLAAFDEDEYLLVAAAIQTALDGREVHGGRPRPPVVIPERMSERGAILIAIAFAADQLRPVDAARTGTLIARFAERTFISQRLRGFPTWEGVAETEALEWCELLAEAERLDSQVPAAVALRLATEPMPPIVVERVLRSPQLYPAAVVAHGILSAEASHRQAEEKASV